MLSLEISPAKFVEPGFEWPHVVTALWSSLSFAVNCLASHRDLVIEKLCRNRFVGRGENGIGGQLQRSAILKKHLKASQSTVIVQFDRRSDVGEGDISVESGVGRFATMAQFGRSNLDAFQKELRHNKGGKHRNEQKKYCRSNPILLHAP